MSKQKKIVSTKIDDDIDDVNKCAPANEGNELTCIRKKELIELSKSFNETMNDGKIDGDEIDINGDTGYLVDSLYNRLFSVCGNDQKCWASEKSPLIHKLSDGTKMELKNYTWRATGPHDNTWLNTTNINKVMKQYERKYPEFLFMGAVPVDIQDLDKTFKDPPFKSMITDNIYKIGVVYNLDEHYKSGSHWVALFSNLKTGKTYYIDSYGIIPEKRIINFMQKCARFYQKNEMNNNNNVKPTLWYNKLRHQYGGSECGVYSINFILKLIRDENEFYNITKTKLPDADVQKCRDTYFN